MLLWDDDVDVAIHAKDAEVFAKQVTIEVCHKDNFPKIFRITYFILNTDGFE